MTFGNTRVSALNIWLERTFRSISSNGFDEFSDAFECRWQNRSDELGRNHVSFFCSLGAFNGHITDLLTDERFDHLKFGEVEEFDEVLFRYYSRVLLVTSEILDDFRKVSSSLFSVNADQLSPNLNKLIAFTNNAVKHKIKLFHYCSHIQIWFYDNANDPVLSLPSLTTHGMWVDVDDNNNPIYETYEDFKKDEDTSIVSLMVPSLLSMIETIIECYESLDKILEDQERFLSLCDRYVE